MREETKPEVPHTAVIGSELMWPRVVLALVLCGIVIAAAVLFDRFG